MDYSKLTLGELQARGLSVVVTEGDSIERLLEALHKEEREEMYLLESEPVVETTDEDVVDEQDSVNEDDIFHEEDVVNEEDILNEDDVPESDVLDDEQGILSENEDEQEYDLTFHPQDERLKLRQERFGNNSEAAVNIGRSGRIGSTVYPAGKTGLYPAPPPEVLRKRQERFGVVVPDNNIPTLFPAPPLEVLQKRQARFGIVVPESIPSGSFAACHQPHLKLKRQNSREFDLPEEGIPEKKAKQAHRGYARSEDGFE